MERLQPLVQAHRLVNARCPQTWVEFQVLPHDRDGRSVFEILVFLLDLDQLLEALHRPLIVTPHFSDLVVNRFRTIQ